MSGWRIDVVAITLLMVSGGLARGQGIVVQQPVVQQFGVDTVVSVPDRGSLVPGGVGSAASGSRRSSLFGPESTYGGQTAGSTMSVHVTIHDLGAMDRALLEQGNAVDASPRAVRPADAAYHQLLSRHRRLAAARPAQTGRVAGRSSAGVPAGGDRAAFYREQARRCRAEGKMSAAEIFERMAARYGGGDAATHSAQGSRVADRKP